MREQKKKHVHSTHVQSMAEAHDARANHARAQQIPQGHHVSHEDIIRALQTLAWGMLVAASLKQDPETALKNGNNPDPMTEIDFWKNKSENLNSICE